jgi:hypothetical protein
VEWPTPFLIIASLGWSMCYFSYFIVRTPVPSFTETRRVATEVVAHDRDMELEAGNEGLSEFIAVTSVCRRRWRWARTLGARPRVHGGGRSPREPFREEHVGHLARRTSMRGARSGGSKRGVGVRTGVDL